MPTKKVAIAADLGNTRTSIRTIYGQEVRSLDMRSAIVSFSVEEEMRQAASRGIGEFDYEKKMVLSMGGIDYLLGDSALARNPFADAGRGNLNRYWDKTTMRLAFGGAASLFDDEEVVACVVVCVPYRTYNDKVKELVKACYVGKHEFLYNGKKRRIIVESPDHVMVVREGYAPAYTWAGYIPGKDMKKPISGVWYFIDGGGLSTEWYKHTIPDDDPEAKPQQIVGACGGTNLGVMRIGDYVSAQYMNEYQVGEDLTTVQKLNILHAYAHEKEYPIIRLSRKEIVPAAFLKNTVEEGIEQLTNDLKPFLQKAWAYGSTGGIANDATDIVLSGGMAYYLDKTLGKFLDGVSIPKEPEHENIRVMMTMAQKLLRAKYGNTMPAITNVKRK